MGKTATHSFDLADQHESNKKSMVAGISMRDRHTNLYYEDQIKYGEAVRFDAENLWSHVEKRLLIPFMKKYNNGTSVPNNARIVIACNWSPCVNCYKYIIPNYMELLDAQNRGIQLKFRYRQLWTQEHRSSGNHLWASDVIAKTAYVVLMGKYGSHTVAKNLREEVNVETNKVEFLFDVWRRYHLVIAPDTTQKTAAFLETVNFDSSEMEFD